MYFGFYTNNQNSPFVSFTNILGTIHLVRTQNALKKLSLLTPWYSHVPLLIGVRNVSFSENLAYLLNGFSPNFHRFGSWYYPKILRQTLLVCQSHGTFILPCFSLSGFVYVFYMKTIFASASIFFFNLMLEIRLRFSTIFPNFYLFIFFNCLFTYV